MIHVLRTIQVHWFSYPGNLVSRALGDHGFHVTCRKEETFRDRAKGETDVTAVEKQHRSEDVVTWIKNVLLTRIHLLQGDKGPHRGEAWDPWQGQDMNGPSLCPTL